MRIIYTSSLWKCTYFQIMTFLCKAIGNRGCNTNKWRRHNLWREANICNTLLGLNADSTRGKLNVYLV